MMRYAGLLTVAMLGIGMAPSARADVPELLACAGEADAKVRLACYDAAAAKLKSELAAAQNRKNTLFGFNLPFGDSESNPENPATPRLGPPEVNEIDAKLVGLSKDFGGHELLALNNGQVWRMEDNRQPLLVAGRDLVALVRNDFGGIYLSVNGRDTKYYVTRVK